MRLFLLGLLAAAAPVSATEWISGRLEPGDLYAGEQRKYFDSFIFSMGEAGSVILDMQSSDLDAYLVLEGLRYDGSRVEPLMDDDSGGGLNSRISAWLSPGFYFAKATTARPDQTGGYRIRLEGPPDAKISGPAQAVSLDEPASGRLTPGDSPNPDGTVSDIFLVTSPRTLNRGEIVVQSAAFDPVLLVTNNPTAGGELKWNVAGVRNVPVRVVLERLGEGVTVAGVSSAGGGLRTGDYTIRVNEVPASTPVTPRTGASAAAPARTSSAPARRIAPGSWVEGRLASGDAGWGDGSYVDDYTLDLSAGDRVVADLVSADFGPHFVLAGAGITASRTGSRGEPITLEGTASADGELKIRVNSAGTGSQEGSYRLRILRTTAASAAPERDETDVETGWIRGRLDRGDHVRINGTYADSHTFRGRSGDTVTLRLEAEGYDPVLFLSGPGAFMEMNDDAPAAFEMGRNSRIEVRLPAAGVYRAVVTSYAPAAGDYRLRIDTPRGPVAPPAPRRRR